MLDGCSSIHTSGYSTGCSLYYPNTTPLTRSLSETALFRTATIVEADTPEDHARLLQPENETSFEVHGRNSSASDSFQTSPDTTDLGVEIDGNEKLEVPVSVSHDSAAKRTATDSLAASGHTSQLPTVRLSNSTDQERSSPPFSASVTLTGTSSEQVSSSTTVTSCTGSSLVNKIATRPPINNHENGKNATTEKSVIKAQHHPLLLEVAPTDRTSKGVAVSPSTAAVSEQLVTEHDKFSLIVRASQAELSRDGIQQHSSSRSSPTSGSNGSGSLIDYAGYLHIESTP